MVTPAAEIIPVKAVVLDYPDTSMVTGASKSSQLQYLWQAYDGYLDLLNGFRHVGVPYGIVSARSSSHLHAELTAIEDDPSGYLFIHGLEETSPYAKPDKRIFAPALKLLAAMSIAPKDILHIGDDAQNCEAALAAGMQFIGVTNGKCQLETFKKAGAQHAVHSLHEIGVLAGGLAVPRLLSTT